ncbi:alpha/beta fold hydrolase [Halorarius halobius]|uniref:alpha/beta fold hydrolase n=1 Tax=Halorarius halobius TaxID=2962671 RepID=UPI0020CE4A9B|nr:alpha/beta hydrolase [Halorarius halobius]
MSLVPTLVDTVVGAPFRVADAAVGGSLQTAGICTDHDPTHLEPDYTDEHSEYVDVAGTSVHYRDEGSGPTLLLLHGTFSSLHTWDEWTERLKSEYRVVRVDLPGHGLTGPHDGFGHNMAGMTAFLEAFCAELGLDDFAVVGNSRGGAVAWRYVLDYDRAERLVLIDAMGFPMNPPTPLLNLLSVPGFTEAFRWLTPEWFIARAVREVYGDAERIAPGTVERYHDLMLHEGNRAAVMDILRRDMVDPELRYDELSEVDVPTLVMWGELDPWLPPEWATRFREEIPDAECITYEGVGHAPMEETPAKSAADLDAFLDTWRAPVSVEVEAPERVAE